MSDRIAVMDRGRVLQIGTPEAIHEQPRSRFVADFMGANILPGALVGSNAPEVAIRPEQVGVTATGPGLAGHVTARTYLGARTACLVALEAGPTIRPSVAIVRRSPSAPPSATTGRHPP